jgi:exopolyphosphatase/guanosine-5'-triphosphate,3'-diphosphate pyrophosphatase
VLSIGTNSTRMLLADMGPQIPHIEAAETIGTRIGEGLGTEGELRSDAMARTLDALRDLRERLEGRYEYLTCIATSALRRARNGDAFAASVAELTGAPLRVLTGEEEARASFEGAVDSASCEERVRAVVDVGGGSTEYAIGRHVPDTVNSYEIGAVRLTEHFPALAGKCGPMDAQTREAAHATAREALRAIALLPKVEEVLCVGGSATTALAVMAGGDNGEKRDDLTRDDLQRLFVQLCGMDLEARKRLPGMRPQRADILPAGIVILDVVLESAGLSRGRVAPGDLLLGVLLQERERRTRDERAEGLKK